MKEQRISSTSNSANFNFLDFSQVKIFYKDYKIMKLDEMTSILVIKTFWGLNF
jgi:hypothetical protein